jgi:hypothetical protein
MRSFREGDGEKGSSAIERAPIQTGARGGMCCDRAAGCSEVEWLAKGRAVSDGLPLLRGAARSRAPRVGLSPVPLHRWGECRIGQIEEGLR